MVQQASPFGVGLGGEGGGVLGGGLYVGGVGGWLGGGLYVGGGSLQVSRKQCPYPAASI